MRLRTLPVISVVLLAWAGAGLAYEPGDHLTIADQSALDSVLLQNYPGLPSDVFEDLGLKEINDESQLFPDSQSGESIYLDPDNEVDFVATPAGTPEDLIYTGAALEDEDKRAMCHFYDPVAGHTPQLTVTVAGDEFQANYNAAEWATGYQDLSTYSTPGSHGSPLAGPCKLSIFTSTAQSYSLANTNDEFYKALTLPAESDRNQQFGLLFVSLGHALHLLQDMAQPQHVRDEMHCDALLCHVLGKYDPSRYERYVWFSDQVPEAYPYPDPDFPDMRSYWSNANNSGLAQFTNANFLSDGTLDGFVASNSGAKYAAPTWDNNATSEDVSVVYDDVVQIEPQDIKQKCNPLTPCDVLFLESAGNDNLTNPPSPFVNPKAATLSLFDKDLAAIGNQQQLTLNFDNYKLAAGPLLGRALGYSVGMLNHFFRGRLKVTFDTAHPGNYLVANVSSYAMKNGALEVYYDADDGNRYPVSGVQAINTGTQLSNLSLDAHCGSGCNDSVSVSITPPLSPAPKSDGEYLFVYKGTIDKEQGVAGYDFKPKYYLNLLSNYTGAIPPKFGPAFLLTIDGKGNFIDSSGLGYFTFCPIAYPNEFCNEPFNVQVFGGQKYAIYQGWGVNAWGNPNLPNGLEFIHYEKQQCFQSLGGLAMNSQNLYVIAEHRGIDIQGSVCPMNEAGWYLDQYDHNGNLISSTLMPEFGVGGSTMSIHSNSANDENLCVITPNGAVLRNLSSGADVALSNSASAYLCTSTRSRYYALIYDANTYGTLALNEYDDTGKLLATVSLAGMQYAAGLSATPSKIYISGAEDPWTGTHTIYVIDRVIGTDSGGSPSESLVQDSNIVINGTGQIADSAIDMQEILDGPDQ